MSNCFYVKFYANFICADPNYEKKGLNSEVVSVTGEKGGVQSRCFDSTFTSSVNLTGKYPFRCYQVICSPTYQTLTIKIGSKYTLCLFPRQKVTVNGYYGILTCPKSFKSICAVKRCPEECNSNGLCIDGKCLCEKSYSGDSCS